MKKFAGNRTLTEIKKRCSKLGVIVDDSAFKNGSDYLKVFGPNFHVLFNTFNGQFFGDFKGKNFDSSDASLDDQDWFNQLLDLFYKPLKIKREQN